MVFNILKSTLKSKAIQKLEQTENNMENVMQPERFKQKVLNWVLDVKVKVFKFVIHLCYKIFIQEPNSCKKNTFNGKFFKIK